MVGEFQRLDVDAFAQTDVRRQVGERGDVVERAPQVGLEHDPDVLQALVAELAVERQGVVRAARVLHVDADEVPPLGRPAHGLLEVASRDVPSQLQPEARELDADVGVQSLLVDRAEDVLVGVGDVPRLLGRRDLLAEDVDRRQLAGGVQLLDDAAGVLDLFAGDVALRDPAHDRLGDGRQSADDGAIQQGHVRRILRGS